MAAGLTVVVADSVAQQEAAADAVVRQRAHARMHVTRICRDQQAALRTLQRLADVGEAELGVETCTLERWGLERWKLYGDGRVPVDAAQRRAATLRALASAEAVRLSTGTPGMVALLERAVRSLSGTGLLDERCEDASAELSVAERDLLQACRTYAAGLKKRGLVEPGDVLALLPLALGERGWDHLVIEGAFPLTDGELRLAAAAARHDGVTIIAELVENAAFEANRHAVSRLEEACRAAGTPIAHMSASELIGRDHPANRASWESTELATLARRLFTATPGAPLIPAGDVLFCLPSGRYAEPELLAGTLRGLVAQGIAPRSIAVACTDPLGMAGSVAGRLAETPGRAVACRASGNVALDQTHVGRELTALTTIVSAERERGDAPAPDLRVTASDAARNPLAALPVRTALELDRTWRGDRATSAAGILADLAKASQDAAGASGDPAAIPTLQACIEALRSGDLAAATRALVDGLGVEGVEERRERAAARLVARLAESTGNFGGTCPTSPDDLARLTFQARVPVSWISVSASDVAAQEQARVLDANPNAVEFCTLPQLEGRSFAAVVLCDLTAEGLSVAERDDACTAFLAHLGVDTGATPLQVARRRLYGALEAARGKLVLERRLYGPDAEVLRPSALLEEIVDCYRADPCSLSDLDRTTGLPKDGSLPYVTLGEERFATLASPTTFSPAANPVVEPGVILRGDVARSLVPSGGLAWSPAALELYLSCPLRWFYERKLPASGVDASFGPRELGSFSRRVLQAFHEAAAKRGIARVAGKEDEETWGPLLDACFNEALANQDSVDNPLVPATRLERERLATVRRNLHGCVERDALLPAGFVPALNEWSFGEDEPVAYGSVMLRGTVHRVDLDAAGHALIVNYKGAFDKGYDVPQPKHGGRGTQEFDPLPQHSQVLMYASALQKVRPETVAAGAVYVSYNRSRAAGFIDATLIHDTGKGAYLDDRSEVLPAPDGGNGFQALLALVEDEVCAAMDRLRDGDLSPRPRFKKDSCRYCTVSGCPRRMN